jgi:hypothetical protein
MIVPLDTLMNIRDEAWCRPWKLKFAWKPQRCYISNELIWLTWGYCGRSLYIINTPNLWMSKNEYLIKRLKDV